MDADPRRAGDFPSAYLLALLKLSPIAGRMQEFAIKVSMATQAPLNGSFRNLFCERAKCPLAQYERRAFNACLYGHAKWLKPLVLLARLDFFAADFKFIRYLGEAVDLPEAIGCAADFQDANLARRGFLRNICKIRVSGRRAILLAQILFTESARP